jgi:hypothetical protein
MTGDVKKRHMANSEKMPRDDREEINLNKKKLLIIM